MNKERTARSLPGIASFFVVLAGITANIVNSGGSDLNGSGVKNLQMTSSALIGDNNRRWDLLGVLDGGGNYLGKTGANTNDHRGTTVNLKGVYVNGGVLQVENNYAFANSLGGNYGSATALSVMLAAVLAVLSVAYFRLTRSWSTS